MMTLRVNFWHKLNPRVKYWLKVIGGVAGVVVVWGAMVVFLMLVST